MSSTDGMSRMSSVVIVGGGATAAAAVRGLRDGGYAGNITLVAAERTRPYDWISLAEGYLSGAAEHPRLLHPHDEVWYAEAGVDLLIDSTAVFICADDRELELADGRRLSYDALLLATGTEAVPLGVPGEPEARELGLLHDLESFDAAERLRRALVRGGQVVVVGSGRAASAAAAAARHWGGHVVLLSPDSTPFSKLFGAEGGTILADLHRDNGVDVHGGEKVTEVLPNGVRTSRGAFLEADVVVAAVPPRPASGLARAAGLTVADGVVVDAALRTSMPGVWAAGSVASAPTAAGEGRVRVDGWSNDFEQGYAAGRSMAGGDAGQPITPYFCLRPYEDEVMFWGSLAAGYDAVVFRGEDEGEDGAEELVDFCAFWSREGRVIAAMDVNSGEPDVGRLVLAGATVDAGKLVDLDTPLAAFL